MLLIHGDDDRNVSFIESINLIIALRKRKVEVEQLVFPDEVHDFLRHQNWVRGYKATADFFNRRLKNAGHRHSATRRFTRSEPRSGGGSADAS